ncbi:hypothetical protein MPTK1_3g06910 [Marchantia polymorpha subsp. ruderalis]|uniref:Metallo-beta-lactamase domain-containing protein n=3 Tax=Marchantia polymorpha TaxID=3197 RepID=A0AAF6AY59_MARPO|nr:hypothetical protein MARPO_0006s0159 [Marchantia polymorpha]BBN04693.1 hypothetical protein Mp_3g06910 [Marchantia polymorpha subsp. ruderalis]|eukprot:PTQ48131.1 hypothetical protein MARPO_0006s0159 [Marchantia polymorpha]
MDPVGGASSSSAEEPRYVKLIQEIETECKVCGHCGTMFGVGKARGDCVICTDDRQLGLLPWGQSWGTYSQLRRLEAPLLLRNAERDLVEISYTTKRQRCFLILNPLGNILWGSTTFLDDAAIVTIKKLGGIRAIAVSHPHELFGYAKWAVTFQCPVYIHERDKNLVVHNTEFIETWDGEELALCSQIKLIRLGGHYDGGAILHWTNNGLDQDGKGVILCADMLQVGEDGQTVSSMRSYHNFIPISESDVQRIIWKLLSVEYERLYASGNIRDLPVNAKVLTNLSLEKYACVIHIPEDEKEKIRDLVEQRLHLYQ